MKTIIFANGEMPNPAALKPATKNAALIIACDGGLSHAHAMGITPHIIIGDLDSAPASLLAEAKANGIAITTHPAEKDETDLELSIIYANQNAATEIIILGATGGRLDHTLANLHMLAIANCPVEILDEEHSIHLVKSSLTLPKAKYKTISLIPLTTVVTGITTTGLTYPLHCETLYAGKSRGVSNEFCAEQASIAVEDGMLLVIRAV
ncbi:MAG: thiamine diphosphokinase [Defluviitaleaceae bacterium]|nr:thiamine diphosphokinase [Defluviitaleaceae bacterium]